MGEFHNLYSTPESARGARAYGVHVSQGPSKPYDTMSLPGMDVVRSHLDASPFAQHHEVSGWVSVEKAFVATQNPRYSGPYDINSWFYHAEESFTRALDLYDPNIDHLDHLCRIELAMASLPFYKSWVTGNEVNGGETEELYGEVAEIGRRALDIYEALPEHNREDRKSMTGLMAELAVMLAYNRRQRSAPQIGTLALPSTLRQNHATHPGAYNKAGHGPRGNWDVSIIAYDEATAWKMTDKLQVKSTLKSADKSAQGKLQYTSDITLVSYSDHVRPAGIPLDLSSGLQVLIDISEPGASRRDRNIASAMSRELYDYIKGAAEARGELTPPAEHRYAAGMQQPSHLRRKQPSTES